MIDSHFHIWTEDTSTPEARADRAEQVRREMAAMGVDRICLIGDYPSGPEESYEYNRDVAKFVEEYPDDFYGWAQVDPRDGDEAVAEFRRAVEEDGLIGLKHHFYGSPVKCSDPQFHPLAEAAVDMDVPILEHVLHRLEPYPEKWPEESYTEDVVELVESFPELKFLSAHIAGGGDWEYRIKNIQDYENVYLDVSGTLRDAGIIEMAAEYLGPDRLVFGTDTWFVPGVGKLRGADLPPADKATIAYNLEELLGPAVPNALGEDELERRREAARERFAEEADSPVEEELVCANGFVGKHQFRRFDASPERLLDVMDEKGVDRTLVSSIESTMYRNCHEGNRELAAAIEGHDDRLIPIATINPTYPAWRRDLDECVDELGMRGVKLLPAYHDYDPDDDAVAECLRYCAERDLPVIFTAVLEDQRGRHPRVKLRDFWEFGRSKWWSGDQVDALVEVLGAVPEADVVIADTWGAASRIYRALETVQQRGVRLDNRVRSGETLFVLGDLNMYFTSLGEDIVDTIGTENLVFGPKLPLKYFEAYYTYLEHLPVDEAEKDRVRSGNLLALFE